MMLPRHSIVHRELCSLGGLGALLTLAALAGPSLHRAAGGMAWLGLILGWSLLSLVALRISRRTPGRSALLIILTAAALMRVALLIEPPYLSSDIYRYVWDGRVQGAGINPYLYVPAAPELEFLRDAAIYPNINRAGYAPTIYPPVAQMLFWLITRFGDSVMAMKVGLLGFEALGIAALIGIQRFAGVPPASVVAYVWHPLPVWEIAGNGHVDAAMLGLMLGGILLFVRGRNTQAGLVVALAAFVKPTALLAMPMLWRPWNWRLPALLIVVAGAVYLPYLSAGKGVFGFLAGYVAEEELASGGGFRYLAMLQRLAGTIPGGSAIYVACAAAVLVGLALRTGFRTDRSAPSSIQALGVLILTFMLLLTPHYPWYYLTFGPLLVLTSWSTPWVLMTGGFVLYPGDSLPPFLQRETMLHLTALAAAAFDVWRTCQRHPKSLQRDEVPS